MILHRFGASWFGLGWWRDWVATRPMALKNFTWNVQLPDSNAGPCDITSASCHCPSRYSNWIIVPGEGGGPLLQTIWDGSRSFSMDVLMVVWVARVAARRFALSQSNVEPTFGS